jgi:hypothetical protein
MPGFHTIDELRERHTRLFKERVSEGVFMLYGLLPGGKDFGTRPVFQTYSMASDGFYPHGIVESLPKEAVPLTQASKRPETLSFQKTVEEILSADEAKERVRKLGGTTKAPKDCPYYKGGWCRIDGKPCPFSTETFSECPKLKDASRHPEDEVILVF